MSYIGHRAAEIKLVQRNTSVTPARWVNTVQGNARPQQGLASY